jgi:transcriptional regulator with XRE-family HTH domain
MKQKTAPHPLKVYRAARGWSAQRLADEAGVCRPTVSRIENRRGEPRIHTAQALAAALDVPIQALFPPEPDGYREETR